MNPNPKMSKFKYAFTGTNCSGKTTMALAVTARMKRQGILAEVVSSQDRKITWKDDYFPVTPVAHYGMITNLIHAEVQAMLKGDADVVITDRSVLDLYAIAKTDHPESMLITQLEPAVLAWMSTYTKVYYLAPLAYQEDGKRPADDFRMRTHEMLRYLMGKYNLPNVVEVHRTDIYKQIGNEMGFRVPNPIFAQEKKWQEIANTLQIPIAVKAQSCETTSDNDVWVLLAGDHVLNGNFRASSMLDLVATYFSADHIFDIMAAPLSTMSDFDAKPDFKVYKPIKEYSCQPSLSA